MSIILIIVRYYKYYYKSQVAYFNSFLGVVDDKPNDTLNKTFIFKYFYSNLTAHSMMKYLLLFNSLSFIYSILMYFLDERVKANGFCGTRVAYLPQIAEFALFLIIFLPLALIEALKFDDKFKMKKAIITLILLHIIYFVGFFLGALIVKLNCSIMVQYTPPTFFVFLSCITSTTAFSLSMIKDILYINKCNKNLKGTYQEMIEMFANKILFREFGEFCRNENCVENILFLQEFWKYKKIFSKDKSFATSNQETQDGTEAASISSKSVREDNMRMNEPNLSGISSSTLVDLLKTTDKNDKKAFCKIAEKEAQKFSDNFIGSNAIYEINIQNNLVTMIKEKMKTLPNNTEMSLDDKLEEYNTLFDKAYMEVVDNIYLNSYSNYVHKKNK